MSKTAELVLERTHAGELAALPTGARVLIVRLRSMGDTVLTTPALRLLREWRPDLRVSVLVESPWDELLEGNPAVDEVLVTRGKLVTTWQVRRGKFDAVINLHGGPTSAFLTRWSGSRLRVGFEHFRNPSAYDVRVPTAQEILGRTGRVHTAEHLASCFFRLGVPPQEIPPAEVFPAPSVTEAVARRLRLLGVPEAKKYAIIHPAALYPSKQWYASGFAEVGKYLEREVGLRPLYVCGKGEGAILDLIESCQQTPILRAEGWPIRELVALIAGARIFLGNDSGPAHIAAAAGIPVVVIFGSSDAAVWRPWKAVESAAVRNDFDCNPCTGDRCHAYDEPRCILSITPAQVKLYLDLLLRKTSAWS